MGVFWPAIECRVSVVVLTVGRLFTNIGPFSPVEKWIR